jgi:hypothetical protein
MDLITDMVEGFRRSIVLLAVENCKLREVLLQGYSAPSIPTSTSDRVVLAAVALKMIDKTTFTWIEPYRTVAAQESLWKRLIALIGHQHTYLQLAKSVNSVAPALPNSPNKQLENSPDDYLAFLQGVAASHWEHAKWFSQYPEFVDATHLVDLGGGLGTFSKAWVEVSEHRTATVVDFPRVATLRMARGTFSETVTFCGADLRDVKSLPLGDVYLLANVLHLLPDWRTVLGNIVSLVSCSSKICVIEADPCDDAGRLFDLQVHLRSGGIAGLIQPDVMTSELSHIGLTEISHRDFLDENDPFQRRYHLWIATRPLSN